MLERQDQPPRLRVVAQRRAGALENRRRGAAAGAQVLLATQRGMRKRHAAARAARLGDESGQTEAFGAEQARRGHRRIAGDAVRRQQQVEQRAAGAPSQVSEWRMTRRHRTPPCRRV
jgi:hypothetical protein